MNGAESNSPREVGLGDPATGLRDDAERFRLLVENSHDIIVEVSKAHVVHYVSPNVARVLGYRPEELVGSDLFEKVHPDDQLRMREHFARRAGWSIGRYQRKDGSWCWFEVTSREFTTADAAVHRVMVARDVTAQKHAAMERERLEAELAGAEKFTAFGALAGGMAHDFNNLLTAILSYGGLARMYPLEPEVRDAIQQIMGAAERAKEIARQVLEFSRQQERARAPMKLTEIVEEVLGLIRPMASSSLEIVADLTAESTWIYGNSTQLHQVVINLCHNAIHAMEGRHGRLVVRVEAIAISEPPLREHHGLKVGPHVCLTVIDNGHGMDEATRRRIFEPFFTTKPPGQGAGIGLAIVRRVVLEHRGVIDVTSRPGDGTMFRIYFPASEGPKAALAGGT